MVTMAQSAANLDRQADRQADKIRRETDLDRWTNPKGKKQKQNYH